MKSFWQKCKERKDVVSCHLTASVENQLKSFRELESNPQTDVRTKDNTECKSFYENTVSQNSGRYMIMLPFKYLNNFGNSASEALKRFNYLDANLNKNSFLREQYSPLCQNMSS